MMSIIGGFLFGSMVGTVWVVIAAITGATAVFLIAKSALGDALRARAGPWLKKLEAGFHENALSYLLVRSEEHTSELQSRRNLVCRLLL